MKAYHVVVLVNGFQEGIGWVLKCQTWKSVYSENLRIST